jgi:hypothetical protein
MSIKLAIKISDGNNAVHVGGSIDEHTHVVEVENEELEKILQPFIKGRHMYSSCSISLVREEK